ncbi:hypothetical protein B0H14DRAFT_2565605 [Mycena olivaceomarginata]|nr:hypothetical protein B0H14DRAFT_2565605 [Mycena olivaceomarginata]
MSIQTGILSNTNNEMSHRMARNCQRRSAAARKARESRETKTHKAQLKNAKAPAPPLEVQSENMSTADAIFPPAETQSPPSPLPEFDSAQAQAATGSEINFLSQFNFDLNMFTDSSILDGANLGGSFPAEAPTGSADPSAFEFAFDPTLFGLSTDFDCAIPSANALSEDPLQDFLNLYAMSDDLHATENSGNVPSVGPFIDPFPMLPPPPPESPPAPGPRKGGERVRDSGNSEELFLFKYLHLNYVYLRKIGCAGFEPMCSGLRVMYLRVVSIPAAQGASQNHCIRSKYQGPQVAPKTCPQLIVKEFKRRVLRRKNGPSIASDTGFDRSFDCLDLSAQM